MIAYEHWQKQLRCWGIWSKRVYQTTKRKCYAQGLQVTKMRTKRNKRYRRKKSNNTAREGRATRSRKSQQKRKRWYVNEINMRSTRCFERWKWRKSRKEKKNTERNLFTIITVTIRIQRADKLKMRRDKNINII